ncbi:hypothetical protein Sjap_012612 [Stephania japonica]|uniref:Uncharacterized protein n=1 Tax=Stephania japonica TaxID=461633 RepID=A0AAP0NZ33_9MAGN
MATRVRNVFQDENLNVHYKGRDANASTAKKSVGGLGGRKALRTITNADKTSPQKMTIKKDLPKKIINDLDDQFQRNRNNSQTRVSIHNENLNAGGEGKFIKPASQKKPPGLGGGRKALSNITNKTSSSQNLSRKNSHAEKVSDVGDEWFLHNHQECINSQKRGVDMGMLWKTLGFEDAMGTPVVPSIHAKDVIVMSPQKDFLELENMQELSPPRWGMSKESAFPLPTPLQSPPRLFASPVFSLRSLDIQ